MDKVWSKILGSSVVLVIVVLIVGVNTATSIIPTGEVGVVKRLGKVQDNLFEPGLNLKIPFITRVHKMDIRTRKIESLEDAGTKDLQSINITIATNYSLPKDDVIEIFSRVGDNQIVETKIIIPAISESVKASTAKFNIEESLTKRDELKALISQNLKDRLSEYKITVENVSIVNIDFSAEFDKAVELKQIAEQQVKKAEFDKQRAAQEAETAIARARGEAKAQELQQQTLNKLLLEKLWIEKWDGKLPQYMTGDSSILVSPGN